mgnify:CR=1 FL=1
MLLFSNTIIDLSNLAHKEELKLLNQIYKSYDEKTLIKLLNNDEIVSRNAYIEKWARIGAIDILLNNIYSRQTYISIINLPREDYQMVIKRIEELIKIAQNLTNRDLEQRLRIY